MLHFNLINYPVRRLLTILFIFSLFIRLVYGLYSFYYNNPSNISDDWAYIKFAEEMLKQGVFVPDISGLTKTQSGITPFFPFLIYLSYKLFGFNSLPLIVMNTFLSSSITVLIYYIGLYAFNNTVGLLSSIWSVIYVNSIRWVPSLLKEDLLQFLFAVFVFMILYYLVKESSYKSLLILSLSFVLLIHTDERYLIYFILFVPIIFLNNKLNQKQKVLSFIYVSILIFIFMLPWLIRNYEVYHRPVILSERTALFTDKFLGHRNDNYFSQEIQLSNETLDSIVKGMPVHDMTLYNLINRGISYGSYPRKYSAFEKLYIDFKELWRPFRFSNMWVSEGYRPEGKWSLVHNLSLIATYGLLLPFFIIGIYYCLRSIKLSSIILISIITIHTVIHITVLLSQNRYRIPIDIIIIAIAFYGIFKLSSRFNYESTK